MSSPVNYELLGDIGVMSIDNPPVNALSHAVRQGIQDALRQGEEKQIKEEVGDLLFASLNIARYLQIDPETALNQANRKFSARFRAMEKHFVSQGRALKEVPLEEMEAFWQDNKQPTADN